MEEERILEKCRAGGGLDCSTILSILLLSFGFPFFFFSLLAGVNRLFCCSLLASIHFSKINCIFFFVKKKVYFFLHKKSSLLT